MSAANLKYKESMDRLNEILKKIDTSEMEIDELADQVQEASVLLRNCRKILTDTERNVQESLQTLDSIDGESDVES